VLHVRHMENLADPARGAAVTGSGVGGLADESARSPDAHQPFVRAVVRTARPKQWLKNALVFAAPGAAGVLTEGDVLVRAILTFVVFCLAASGTYFLNDLLDREADARHPTKRHRPLAAGIVSAPTGAGVAAGLLLAALVGAVVVGGIELGAVVGAYVALTVSYSFWLKHVAVVDLGAVAAGFVLRAIGGGVAVDVPLSDWFLIVASSGSLFMIAGKRAAEHNNLGDARGDTRAILEAYSIPFLRHVRSVSSAVAITAYCVWAFEKSVGGGVPWFELSIAPFVLGMLRYALLLDADAGEAPEDLVLGDRPLQVIGLIWVALFALGVHGS
jgi:decaprenyl-phosphate phosphoribosyltransferase